MRAQCLLRESVAFRRDAFTSGLGAAGYKCVPRIDHPTSDDVLVIWNRYGTNASEAARFERQGARVLVCENGHLGKSWRSGVWYSITLERNGGAGRWLDGGPQRWDSWNVELAPWRDNGREYVLFGQRGIGEAALRSPPNWADATMWRLNKNVPGTLLRIRPHPREVPAAVTLEQDLNHAIASITWNSAAAVASLVHGVPVYYDCPSWIGAQAGRPLQDLFKKSPPLRDDDARLAMFRRLAWAMWEVDEIRAGAPFRHLLARQREAA